MLNKICVTLNEGDLGIFGSHFREIGATIEHAEVQVKLNELAEKVGGWRSMSDANFHVFLDRYMNGNFILKYALDDHEVFQEELKRRVDEDIIYTVQRPKRESLLKRLSGRS